MMDYLVSMNRHFRLTIFFTLIFTSFFLMINTGNLTFAIFFFIFLGMLIYSNVLYDRTRLDNMKKSIEKTLIKINFHSDLHYLSDDFLSGIAMNKEERKIVILRKFDVKDEFVPHFYNFTDILECSIVEDGETVSKTTNGSLIGRTIAGGILFGGIGAVVGGVSSQRVSSEKIYKASLSVVIDDIDYPIHEIHFLNSKMLIDRNSESYTRIYNDLNKWHKTLSVIIKRNERELNSKLV